MSSTSSDGADSASKKQRRYVKTLPSGSSTTTSKDGEDGDTEDVSSSSDDDDVQLDFAVHNYVEPKVSIFAACFFRSGSILYFVGAYAGVMYNQYLIIF